LKERWVRLAPFYVDQLDSSVSPHWVYGSEIRVDSEIRNDPHLNRLGDGLLVISLSDLNGVFAAIGGESFSNLSAKIRLGTAKSWRLAGGTPARGRSEGRAMSFLRSYVKRISHTRNWISNINGMYHIAGNGYLRPRPTVRITASSSSLRRLSSGYAVRSSDTVCDDPISTIWSTQHHDRASHCNLTLPST
jgi:hypothetical protein